MNRTVRGREAVHSKIHTYLGVNMNDIGKTNGQFRSAINLIASVGVINNSNAFDIGKGIIADLVMLNNNNAQGRITELLDGVPMLIVPLAGQAIIIVSNAVLDSIQSTVFPLTVGWTIKPKLTGEQNKVTYIPLQLSTQTIVQAITSGNSFVAPYTSNASFLIAGAGAVPNLTIKYPGGAQSTYNLNSGNTLANAELFGFSIPIVSGCTYTIGNATYIYAVLGE